MTYYRDLSPYDYWSSVWPPRRPDGSQAWFNVGWLGEGQPYEAGNCPDGLVDRLVELAAKPARLTRGVHNCEFCDERSPIRVVTPSGKPCWLGNGEISVAGLHGETYVSPTLIVHYVRDHRYLPPQEFIDSVLKFHG